MQIDSHRPVQHIARLRLAIAACLSALALPLPTIAEAPAESGADTNAGHVDHDWPSFLGPRRDGKSRETGLDFDWPPEGPPILWQNLLGAGYTAPAIDDGRLFHYGRHGDRDRLTCRDAATGAELWQASSPTSYEDLLGYNNGPRCSPVVDGKRVYTLSAQGQLQCRSTASGDLLWQLNTTRQFHVVQNFFGVGSTPVVYQNAVIVNVGGSPPGGPADVYAARGRVQGDGSGVVAFDKATGDVLWKRTEELASYAAPVVSEVNGRPWCFVFARGGLVALDPRTGEVDFQHPWRASKLESVNAASPVVVGNEVFISEAYGPGSCLLRFRPGVSEVVWKDTLRSRQKSMMLHWNTPIHHDGHLYGSSGQHSGSAELRCIDWSSGAVRWRHPGLGRCSLLYVDGRLICLGEDGVLSVISASPDRFELLSSTTLRDEQGRKLLRPPAWTAPVVCNKKLYVRGDDRLVCIAL